MVKRSAQPTFDVPKQNINEWLLSRFRAVQRDRDESPAWAVNAEKPVHAQIIYKHCIYG